MMDGSTMPAERGRTADGGIDPDQIEEEIASRGKAWAELRATAKLLELQLPATRAAIIQKLLDDGKTAAGRRMTRRDAEELVLCDVDYQAAQESAVDMRRQANVAEATYKAVQARFEAMRTAESTRRAEMHAYNR